VYDLEGNYLETHQIDLWASYFSYIANHCIAFYGNYTANLKYETQQTTPNLFITEDYKVIHADLYFPSKTNFSALLSAINYFSSGCNDLVSFWEMYNDTIYHLTSNTFQRAYYIDFGKMKKDKAFYDLIYSPTATRKAISDNNACNMIAVSETETCLFFAYHHQNVYHYVFYYKNTEKVFDVCRAYHNENVPVFPIRDDIHGIRFAIPYFTDGHSFYSWVDAYEIADIKDSITDLDLKEKLKDLSEYDNPVIVIMTPKK
jgi:hypothetical protein